MNACKECRYWVALAGKDDIGHCHRSSLVGASQLGSISGVAIALSMPDDTAIMV